MSHGAQPGPALTHISRLQQHVLGLNLDLYLLSLFSCRLPGPRHGAHGAVLQRAELLEQLWPVLVRLEVEEVCEDAGLGHGDRAGVLDHDHGWAGCDWAGAVQCTVYCLLGPLCLCRLHHYSTLHTTTG